MTLTHVIRKQTIDLVFTSHEVAEKHWEDFGGLHKDNGHRSMQELFDEVAPEERWIYIDRLEIDLGIISEDAFRTKYPALLRSMLEKEISSSLSNQSSSTNTSSDNTAAAHEENILHYLIHGTFRWQAMPPEISQQQSEEDYLSVQLIQRIESTSPKFIAALRNALRTNQVALQRIIRRFSSRAQVRLKERLLNEMTPTTAQLVKSARILLEKISAKIDIALPTRDQLEIITWQIHLAEDESSVIKYITEYLEQCLPFKHAALTKNILKKADSVTKVSFLVYLSKHADLLFEQTSNEENPSHWITDELIQLGKHAGVDDPDMSPGNKNRKALSNDLSQRFQEEKKSCEEESGNESNAVFALPDSSVDTTHREDHVPYITESVIPDQDFYISNAGIILLSPFIDPFFQNAGIDTSRLLKDDHDASLGVHLLQLLTSGSWEDHEGALALNKVLCGRSPVWPAYRVEKPEQIEKESNELLQTVIGYWDALKRTSPEGLQETFLRRDGRLTFRDEQWQLKVEYKTPDILLGSLPWGLSVIKLPWMHYPLYIDW
jgi:hypothetical protein